jgi:predicted MFS family arabinose efflux permease
LRVILLRAGLFMLFANSLWALLPLVARAHLHLGSGGYGLLLGGVGVGAVAGAAALPRLRSRLPLSVLLTGAMITLAAATAALAYVRVSAAAAIAVVVSGVGWILVLSILNSQYQGTLPGWAKARGMSYYLVVFQGGGAAGAAVFGVLAPARGTRPGDVGREHRTRTRRAARPTDALQINPPGRPVATRDAGPVQ